MLIGSFCAVRFIWWRLHHSLNFDGIYNSVATVALVGAETYTVMIFLLFAFQLLSLKSPDKLRYPTRSEEFAPPVDIFIVTYNERVEIVKRTIAGALNIRYPNKKIYLCDDGRRREMMLLADSMGCEYITRPDNKFAKAGNLNNALATGEGDFVLILDADHVPASDILDIPMGYFEHEPKVAMVQCAHKFMNPGPVERNLCLDGRLPGEQELFFQLIQVGKNDWNAAFFAGSASVFRRQIIDEVGGIPTRSVAEDCELTIEIHRRGYVTKYVHFPKILGLSPETLASYLVQQRRWTRGSMQLLRFYNPLTITGLTMPQRICYVAGMLHFFYSIPRLIYLCIPSVFLLFGVCPMAVDVFEYVVMGSPYLLLYVLNQNYVFRNYRHSFWSDVYEIINAPFLATYVVRTLANPAKVGFQVTPKGIVLRDFCFNASVVTPHMVFLGIILCSFFGGFIQLAVANDVAGVLVNLGWNVYNSVLLLAAICVAVERPQSRRAHRIRRSIPVTIDRKLATADGDEGEVALLPGNTVDLNEFGARVKLLGAFEELKQNDQVRLNITTPDGDLLEINCTVVKHASVDANGMTTVCLVFDEIENNPRLYQSVIDIVYSSNPEWELSLEPLDSIGTSLGNLITSPVRVAENIIDNKERLRIAVPKRNALTEMLPNGVQSKLMEVGDDPTRQNSLMNEIVEDDNYDFFHDPITEDAPLLEHSEPTPFVAGNLP
jgi:cellulose synthase (UDP-forming)